MDPQLANENFHVYIKRKRHELKHGSQPTCGQDINPISSPHEENIGMEKVGDVPIPKIDDSTMPIVLRKGVRRCTCYPIGNYVTYRGLSPSYKAFATSLDDIHVPSTTKEALQNSKWKKSVQDEIDALENNGTWTISDLPAGKMPVGFYVNDIILSGKDVEELQNLNKYLSEEFEVKDLENLKYFLAIEVARSRKNIVVSQRKNILDLLKETDMLRCKPVDTPTNNQKKFGTEKESISVGSGRYKDV
ncbi:uncharacterized protein LOC110106718 [Dendrobium catenatum]|uniref:uncharacterized protein LOC110106718 n=1 Tax=Dendrobium catenatum TaxID=906689 RepID=UPI00109F53F3|nr:uncharacterized protein LOC110106718 [Dendrobium catenatum]